MRRAIPALLALAFAAIPAVQAQSIEIIVHPDTEVTSVTRAELSKIFRKRLRTWEDRMPAVPVDQVPDSPAREEFSHWIHERSIVNIEIFWKKQIFSGRAVPPPELLDDDAVIDFVRTTHGAVGYVRKSARLGGVRRLEVTD